MVDLNRRNFLRDVSLASLIGLGGCASTGLLRPEEKMTQANRLLRYFPEAEDLPGAMEVVKHEFPGSKFLFIHVLNVHRSPGLSSKSLNAIINVQKNIYTILTHLRERYGIDEVYTERVVHGDEESVEESYATKFKAINTIGSTTNEYNSISLGLGKYGVVIDGPLEDLLTYEVGAVGKLVAEEQIKVLSDMSSDLYAKSENIFVLDREFLEEREDYFLKLVVEKASAVALGVVGALHAFGNRDTVLKPYFEAYGGRTQKNNVAEWNRKNPDRMISLCEILPAV